MTQLHMDWTDTSLPVSGRTSQARHSSATGAQQAAVGRGAVTLRYLELLAVAGPLSDHQAARMLGCGVSSVNSTRDGCGALVRPSGRFESVTWPGGRITRRVKWERAE